MPAVSNTSPISNLTLIGRLALLADQFGEVWIPKAVETELGLLHDSAARKSIDDARRSGWLKARIVSDMALVSVLTVGLHPGEAEAIALAFERKADWLLMDERDGRSMARQLGLRTTGVIGVLLRAKNEGKIRALKPEIDALRNNARFFISPVLEAAILVEAGE